MTSVQRCFQRVFFARRSSENDRLIIWNETRLIIAQRNKRLIKAAQQKTRVLAAKELNKTHSHMKRVKASSTFC